MVDSFRTEREIDFLREYRTRLIAAVVTGKLDVRDAAARLPKEAEETESIDDFETLTEDGEADADAANAGAIAEDEVSA